MKRKLAESGSLALLAWLSLASPLRASDGVIEINQAKALAGGVTPGDAQGFPVTIATAGSYRLTGNLDVTGGATAISVVIWNVTLDLGGFSVAGSNACTGYPVTGCTVTSGNSGIHANANAHHIVVRNGVVRNFNGHGVRLEGASSVAEDLRAMLNGGSGIYTGVAARVRRCISLANYTTGISVIDDSHVSESEARANGSTGIFTFSSGSTVRVASRYRTMAGEW